MSVLQRSLIHLDRPVDDSVPNILILNSSAEMAKLVTHEIQKCIPTAKLLFAPSIAVAEWLVNSRKFDLIIADAILPDGSISRLNRVLSKLKTLPDLIVVGEKDFNGKQILINKTYKLKSPTDEKSIIASQIGADLRNDLNNPLQQIVAMAFVARNSELESNITKEALVAIETAAQSMAGVVWGFEEKVLKALNL